MNMVQTMPAKFASLPTRLAGLKLLQPNVLADSRGYFLELHNQRDFDAMGIDSRFVQTNFSSSRQDVIRGLHFQRPPHEMSKLVYCPQGEVFDVAVDIRPDSETFGQWEGFVLSEENRRLLYIPAGFAHGFAVLSEVATILYQCDAFYEPTHDAGITWNDSEIDVRWPVANPILSEKDQRLPSLQEALRAVR